MTRHLQLIATGLAVLATLSCAQTQSESSAKWSRQLESVGSGAAADSLDWVPLAQPLDEAGKDRSDNGRVLTYSQSFPPSARFGELTKPTVGQFDYPFQFQRFPNGAGPQALPLRHQVPPPLKTSAGQEPTSQSFFKFEMPFHNEAGLPGPAQSPPTLQTGYQIQHSFGAGGLPAPSSIFSPPSLFGQQQQSQQFADFQKPFAQALSKPLHQQNFIQDTLPVKSHGKPLPTQASLQSVTPQVFPVDPEPETVFGLGKPASAPTAAASGATASAASPQQEVQLLYVPYDTLYNQQRPQSGSSNNNFDVNKFNVNPGLPAVNPYQINQFYTSDPSVGSDFFSPGTTKRPITTTTSQPQHIFQSFGQPQFTTAKPKPKAHQPPLAMFLLRPNARPSQSDVVAALRTARTISVIDSPTKQTPEIFVGPAGMPIPDGYVKFDLPYLSQLTHSRDLNDVSFFVAPLSYRTPNGFNKILLPEPHVGSIVINRAKESEQLQPQAVRSRPYSPPTPSTRNPFETSTQPITAPTRGNKFSYYYVQDGIQEVNSPKLPPKQERHKKKRPTQHVQHSEQPAVYRAPAKTQLSQHPFDTLNQIGGDDFFSSLSSKGTTSSTSSSTTTTTSSSTTSTTATPQTLFTYGSQPQVDFPSSNGQLYPQFNPLQQQQQQQQQDQVVQEPLPRLTTRPPAQEEEEQRMKQYFRQQDAFRQRPQTTIPPFEQVQYTPTSVDIDAPQPTTQKTKQRVTIYTPGTVPVTTSDVGYNVDAPLNHRPSYNQNEVIDSNLEYEPNPYHVPSELPPLTPDIPGLVNNLQEKHKLQVATTTQSSEPETRPTRRPVLRTRKPASSKVVTSSSVTYSESETSSKQPTHRIRRPYNNRGNDAGTGEETVTTTRRPSSGRNTLLRNPNRIRYQPTNEERQSLKIKTKKKITKNGKPVEDQDLDYQRDVLKQNYPVFKSSSSRRPTSPTAIPSSYDVGNTEGPASETQQIYTVTPSNNHIDGAVDQSVYPAGLLEPMQIAQHYNEFSKDNYGPGYFPNQEDLNPTEAFIRNEVNPVYTTLPTTTTPATTTTTTTTERTTTTTEEPLTTTTTTRRSPFIRRNYPRVRTTTTTEAAITTTTPAEERPSIRSRLPPRRVVKVRQRQRRPGHPASTAAPEQEVEPVTQRQQLRKLSRYNQEQQQEREKEQTPRRRYKQPFQLEGQESQWSPASETGNANSNSFKPLNPKYGGSKTESHSFEAEPEIVTAGPTTDQPETYEFNVAANLGGSESASAGQRTTPSLKAPNLKPEKSFAELLEEVMGKAPEELATEAPTSSTFSRLNRRGKWQKKTRLANKGDQQQQQQQENFETAESQNLGPQLYNSLYSAANEKSEQTEKTTTTPLTPATDAATTTEMATTTAQPTTPEEYQEEDVTTARAVETTTLSTTLAMSEDSATRRMDTAADVDDLDTQPSIFSEVRQQLHDLFAIDESEDEAVTAALAAVGKRRQATYTSIKRTKPVESTTEAGVAAATTAATPDQAKDKDNFHKDLMEHVVYATSTSAKVTSETEICYRGRCIRSEDLPANHKLH